MKRFILAEKMETQATIFCDSPPVRSRVRLQSHEQKVHQGSGLKNHRAWADIIAQIIRLRTLYQSIKSGDDLLLQDR